MVAGQDTMITFEDELKNLEGKYIGVIKCALCSEVISPSSWIPVLRVRLGRRGGSKCARVTLFLSGGLSAHALQAFDLF